MKVAIVTVSDACSRGERVDESGALIEAWARGRGDEVALRATVADESVEIVRVLLDACDSRDADVVFTTGGTGLSKRDVTPEATRAVIEREAPGIAELMRMRAVQSFPRAALSRGIAGTRGESLVINLAGSPGAVRDGLAAIEPIIDHARDILRGMASDHAGAGEKRGA